MSNRSRMLFSHIGNAFVLYMSLFGFSSLLCAADSALVPEQWPATSEAERRLRDSALVITGLTERDPNAAYREFATAIPSNASQPAIQKLREVLVAQKWMTGRPDTPMLLKSLIEAYLRASPAHSVWDLVDPRYGDTIALTVFDVSSDLKVADRTRLVQAIATAKVDLGNRKDLLWMHTVARELAGKGTAFLGDDGADAFSSSQSDAVRYFLFVYRTQLGDVTANADIEKLFEDHEKLDDFVSFFFDYGVISDKRYASLVKRFLRAQSNPERDHSVVRETVLYKLLKHLPRENLDEEMITLITAIQSRSAMLPTLVTSANVDERISRYFYVALNQAAAASVLGKTNAK